MPMDRSKYPDDWEQISQEVRDAAGNKCQECGVENGMYGYRQGRQFVVVAAPGQVTETVKRECRNLPRRPRCFRIVLTVAHLDHDTTNSDRANLRAWCQRCHLRYDHEHHLANAAETRALNRAEAATTSGQMSLIYEIVVPRARMSDEERRARARERSRVASEKRRADQKAAWEEYRRTMARVRRSRVIKGRKHLVPVLTTIIDHVTGRAELTDESYREQRQWLLDYFGCEKAHDSDIAANLPHLRLVDPTFEEPPKDAS